MHTYDDTETYVSLVRTMPDLTGWSIEALLSEHAHEAVVLSAVHKAGKPDDEVLADLEAVAGELKRRAAGQESAR